MQLNAAGTLTSSFRSSSDWEAYQRLVALRRDNERREQRERDKDAQDAEAELLDFAVAMAALDATVLVVGARGERRLPFTELHRLPGDTPHLEHNLAPDEVIEGYRLTRTPLARHSHYLKVRDRGEFEWAICSAAVALELDHGGRIADARVAVGGVATKPWRLGQVETALQGRQATAEAFAEAAALSVQNAVAHGDNAYKLALLPRTIARALTELRERL